MMGIRELIPSPHDRVKAMLVSLKAKEYDQKSDEPYRDRVNLYCDVFDVSTQEVNAYLDTLPRLVLVHPVCPLCGREWSEDMPEYKATRLLAGGTIIDWVDSVMTSCMGGRTHDHIEYYQSKGGNSSMSLDIDMPSVKNWNFQLCWNCSCAVKECFGKNSLMMFNDDNYITLKEWDEPLPYNVPKQELVDIIKKYLLLM